MALSRKLLEGMGLEDKQIESIIEAHADTVNGLKAERDGYKEQAGQVAELQKKLEDAQAATGDGGDWEQKFNDEHKAFEDFKAQVDTERTNAAKDKAYREMLAGADIDPRRIDAIMRVTDLSAVEVEDGKLKSAEELADAAKKEWADFVIKTKTEGSNPATPPTNNGGVEGADPEIAARQRARHERLFGKSPDKE